MNGLGNYYNENDPKAAQWLLNLIEAKLIPAGHVDQRSIKEVRADDLAGFTQCHFFAGIAGWSLALAIAGWPEDAAVWTGSCPCQPFSAAGKRKGTADERHLWPDFHRLIAECGPAIVFGEQVASKDGREWLAGVRADLEALGYAVGAADLCAASIAAPNKRARLWWVADSNQPEFRGQSPAGKLPVDEPDDRSCDRMADTGSERCGPRCRGSSRTGSPRLHGTEFGADSEPGGLADTSDLRSPEHEHHEGERTRGSANDAANCYGSGGMGNASGTRQPQREIEQDGCGASRIEGTAAVAPSAAWIRARIIECRDGRARRVSSEPGDEPLAYGIPSRMGRGKPRRERLAIRSAKTNRVCRISGYGNAINPWVAAEFIRAYIEASTPLTPNHDDRSQHQRNRPDDAGT